MKSSCCLSVPADPTSSVLSNIVCTYISMCLRVLLLWILLLLGVFVMV